MIMIKVKRSIIGGKNDNNSLIITIKKTLNFQYIFSIKIILFSIKVFKMGIIINVDN